MQVPFSHLLRRTHVIEPERLAYRAVTVNTKPLAFTVTYNLSEVTYNHGTLKLR